ncbi:MAG TPA: Hsp20/alpha crystallin family protein [Planctomycetaceae bacterium]|nr:Hsp20/alpha crystallin family protein [Planctomycetaceae bacterium]
MSYLTPWTFGVTKRGDKDPFALLQQEINRTFDHFFDDSTAGRDALTVPKLDVSETPNEVHVTAELPGMSEQDISVELLDDVLKIRGEKKDERETKDHQFHRVERSFGVFERAVPLPVKVQREGVNATFKHGVLTVVLPKAQSAPGHQKIEVKAGA